MGNIRIALDEQKAPITVKNFLAYVRAGHYDGTIFHRVIPGFMIQGGGMDATHEGEGHPPPIKNEAANKLRNDRGTVAMARTAEPNSATAQFFINVKNNASLDYGIGGAGYAVFGTVIEGHGRGGPHRRRPHDQQGRPPGRAGDAGGHQARPRRRRGPRPPARRGDDREAGPRAAGLDAAPRTSYRSENALMSSAALAGSSFITAASPSRRA